MKISHYIRTKTTTNAFTFTRSSFCSTRQLRTLSPRRFTGMLIYGRNTISEQRTNNANNLRSSVDNIHDCADCASSKYRHRMDCMELATRRFSHAAPFIWNSVPLAVRSASSLRQLIKDALKTYLNKTIHPSQICLHERLRYDGVLID